MPASLTYRTEDRTVKIAAATNSWVKNKLKLSNRNVSANAPSRLPQSSTASTAHSANPKILIQARSGFSCSAKNRSSSMTTKAASKTCAAGKSGTRLTSIAVYLSAGCIGSDRRSLRATNSLQGNIDRRLHPAQKRLRINSHDDDQRDNRSENKQLAAIQIEKLLVLRMGHRSEKYPPVHP